MNSHFCPVSKAPEIFCCPTLHPCVDGPGLEVGSSGNEATVDLQASLLWADNIPVRQR